MTASLHALGHGASAGAYYTNDPHREARNRDEYYARDGGGRWWTRGAALVRHGAPIVLASFRDLCAGLDPASGRPLVRGAGVGHRAGWDLTLTAPKTVSLLWAAGDPEQRSRLEALHAAAVAEALDFLCAEELAEVRLGAGGHRREVPAGLMLGVFDHYTSRAGDPNCHTHCVLINAAPSRDGRYRTLEPERLYRWQLVVGSAYRAALAERLVGELGLTLRPAGQGQIEIAGIPEAAIAAFSKRSAAIEARIGGDREAASGAQKEIAALATRGAIRLYLSDTLADPDEETSLLFAGLNLEGLAQSRKGANRVKRSEAITVVIGNPPYKEKAKGRGGWVEDRGKALRAPLEDWQPPVEWGLGAHAKHLRNLYVYFWRWAAWKVFGGDDYRGGIATAPVQWTERRGIICFITVSGFLNGPGFQKMRADLRRDADEILVIDCSPEGHQPAVGTRIFQGVQQPVCIVLALRRSASKEEPATVRFRSLPEGARELKFKELANITLDDTKWVEAPSEWRAPFLPAGAADWIGYPALEDLFAYNGSGVMAGRTWVIAPDEESLRKRWAALINEKDLVNKEALFHPHLRPKTAKDRQISWCPKDKKPGDKHVNKSVKDQLLSNYSDRTSSVASETRDVIKPERLSFRSFDRQWTIPDARLLNQPNRTLWQNQSSKQAYITALIAHSPSSGPALSIAGHVPDLHHYKGSFGGRVFPLWADAAATNPNTPPGLLTELSEQYGRPITVLDLFAYIAAVAASPAYTKRFGAHLKQPGLRIPITAGVSRAVVLGHSWGSMVAVALALRPHSSCEASCSRRATTTRRCKRMSCCSPRPPFP